MLSRLVVKFIHFIVVLPSCGGMRPVRSLTLRYKRSRVVMLPRWWRDAARQLVGAEFQVGQLGEIAQLWWDAARQLVGVEVQPSQLGEIAQFRRDGARQLVVVEPQ